jgi:hypothetical protein
MLAGAFDQRRKVRMASTTFAGDAGKLSFGSADRSTIDEPVNRHSRPSLRPGLGTALGRRRNATA